MIVALPSLACDAFFFGLPRTDPFSDFDKFEARSLFLFLSRKCNLKDVLLHVKNNFGTTFLSTINEPSFFAGDSFSSDEFLKLTKKKSIGNTGKKNYRYFICTKHFISFVNVTTSVIYSN